MGMQSATNTRARGASWRLPRRTGCATATSRRLAREEGLLVGISAGANVFAACGIAGSLSPEQVVLTVLPDTGERYLSLSQ